MVDIPQLSVIVPVYNVEKYLDKCIRSILGQTFKNYEIILVDDGSKDNCPMMCDAYALKYENIKVIHKENSGLGMACNTGIEVATGEYVAFCDSDDYVDSDMYERMVNVAEEYQADAVFTGLKRVDDAGNEWGRLPHYSEFVCIEGQENLYNFLKDMIASEPSCREERKIQVSAKVVLYRRSIIIDNNLRFVSEREYPSEDLLFNMAVLAHSRCACVMPEFFYNYRVNPHSITHSIRLDKFQKLKAILKYSTKFCNDMSIEGGEVRTQRMFMGYIRSYLISISNSTLPFKQKWRLINDICYDEVWSNIKSSYPINIMPFNHRVFAFFIINHLPMFLMLTAKCKK